MIIKEHLLEIETIKPSENFLLPEQHYFYFDIETTGLSRERNHIMLISLGFVEDNQYRIKQYFAENTSEEKNILKAFSEDILRMENERMNIPVSYNGAVFDIPFLNKAFQRNDIAFRISEEHHLDLLAFLRPLKKMWQLNTLKLKEVEAAFDIHRQDSISGKESIILYKEYLKGKNPVYLRNILLHNYEDVKHLIFLHRLIKKRMSDESLVVDLPSNHIQTFFYHYSKGQHKDSFYFKNLHSTLHLHYFYDNGEELFVDSQSCTLNLLTEKGQDQDGNPVRFTFFRGQPLVLFQGEDILKDHVYFMLENKIKEFFV